MGDSALNLVVKFAAIDKLTGGLKNIVQSGKAGAESVRNLQREVRAMEKDLARVNRLMRDGTSTNGGLIMAQRELTEAIARTNRELEREQAKLKNRQRWAKLAARGEKLKEKGTDNIVGGTAMLAPFIAAGKAAMDFSSGMVDIQQKAQLSNRETAEMAANILRLSKAAHQLPEDMRAGVDVLAGMGMDPRQAIRMIGPIGRLGTAFKVDLADGAQAAFANVNNLKVPIEQITKAQDMMAASGNAGAFEVKDMARWFPALTAQAQALGQKGVSAVADLSAALQIARRATGDADTAGNNVQNLLAKIQSPGTIKAFQKNFGVDLPKALRQAYAQGKSPLEAIAELTKKATGGDLSKIGFAFEDMQAQSAVRALIQNFDDFKKMRADLANSGGTVDAAFGQRELQDASIQWKSFLGQLQTFGILVGTKILPSANQLLGGVNRLLDAFGSWAERNPQLSSALITLVGGLGLARIAVGGLLFVFGGLMSAAGTLWPILTSIGSVIATVVAAVGIVPLAIGAALAVVAYLVYSNWGAIKAAFAAGWAWIKTTFAALPGWLKSIGSQMMLGLLSALNPAVLAARLVAIARQWITAFKNFFGIKSPSRLMMQMGGHIATGLGHGIDGGARKPLRAMGRLATGVAGAGALSLAGPSFAAGAPRAATTPSGPIEIHIHQQPGESAEALAQRVAQVLERRGGGSRGSYGDDF